MFIPIVPMGKPRMTQRDRWKQRPVIVRYHAFCDELRLNKPPQLGNIVRLTFYLPMPPSWSAKKKAAHIGHPHQQKPDIDNLSKSVLDALCPDDSYIYSLHAEKYWAAGFGPGIIFHED